MWRQRRRQLLANNNLLKWIGAAATFSLSLSPKWQLQCVKAEDGDRRKAQHNTYSASARSLNWWHLFGCCLRFAVPSLFFFFSFFSTKGFLCAFLFLLWIWFIASQSEGRRKTEGNGMEGEGEKEKAACVLTKRSLLRNCHCRRLIARFWLFPESSRPPLFSLGR